MNVLGPVDLHLFGEGKHARIWERLGAHPTVLGGRRGTSFGVWAPNARLVEVVGDFNGWGASGGAALAPSRSGVWTGFLPGLDKGDRYKYRIHAKDTGYRVDKADPVGFACETPPNTASVIAELDYAWRDQEWMATRKERSQLRQPMSIYELHVGSFMRVADQGSRSLSYRELARPLIEHVTRTGFTHVELLPIMEHPFYGSWGYQVTGFFAPTSRYGSPQDLMYLIDELHRAGIGVILDWPPAHFPTDQHGLGYFDGTHLYEHADARRGFHPEWGSAIFNYDRHEVRSFLISCANFWLELYHADGLRVDAVASMLYLDYGRKDGEWIPNEHGGKENLGAIRFLRDLNEAVYRDRQDIQTIAEESTAWPMVSRPTYVGGLGFGFKWDMGFMHDTLSYFSKDPVFRKYEHQKLTFRSVYAWNENFILPFSHDEVVHGKRSLLERMPGDDWQKFANLRLVYAYMWAQPGKKMLFMGGEFAQRAEWDHDRSLDWHLAEGESPHARVQLLVGELNRLYRQECALHELDCDPAGFEWIEASDADASVYAFQRKSSGGRERVIVAINCTPIPRVGYRVGVDAFGYYRELLNTDATAFGGSGMGNAGGVHSDTVAMHGRPHSLSLTLPPLAAVWLKAPSS